MNRISGEGAFKSKEVDGKEFEQGKKNVRNLTFKYYVNKEQLKKFFNKKDLKNIELYRLGNELYIVQDIQESKKKEGSKSAASKNAKNVNKISENKKFIPVESFV